MAGKRRESKGGGMRYARWGLRISVVTIAIALGACGGTQSRPPALPSSQIAAPLNLCPPAAAPADLLSKPGFTQFAVSVTDASGRPVTGLKQSDFEARSGGQTMPIQYFHEEPDGAPKSIVIVVDLSQFMAGGVAPRMSKVEAVQKMLPDAVNRLNQCDEIAILVIGGNQFPADRMMGRTTTPGSYQDSHGSPITLLQPFTTDHPLALMRLADRTAYEVAPLYDAIQEGLNVMASAHYQNRALIVTTEGVDFTSSVRTEDLIASINQSGIPVYAIELGEPYAHAFPPFSGLVIPIPFLGKTGTAAAGTAASGKAGSGKNASGKAAPAKPMCADFKCVDTGMLAKVTAPTGGKLLIVPQPLYDPRMTLKDELDSTVVALNHGYAIGVVAPAGSALPAITLANHRQMKVRAHVISGAQ